MRGSIKEEETIEKPLRQLLGSRHRGSSVLTSGLDVIFHCSKITALIKSGKLTELLYEVTVIDAFLRAEGGQLKSGRLLFFLLGDKKIIIIMHV